MSFHAVKQYFESAGMGQRVMELSKSSATVEEAAEAIGCEPKQIAKTMSFIVEDAPILVVVAGDAKIDNKKYKAEFHQKAKMIPPELVQDSIGHVPGGVCPFALQPDVKVYLDVSLKRFEKIYPAGGNGHSAVELTLEELMFHSSYIRWVDVCKGWFVNE